MCFEAWGWALQDIDPLDYLPPRLRVREGTAYLLFGKLAQGWGPGSLFLKLDLIGTLFPLSSWKGSSGPK